VIEAWLVHLNATKPAKRTLGSYRADIEGVARRIGTDGVAVLRLEHLTKSALQAGFASWASDHPTSSVVRAHSAWSSLLDFLVGADLIEGNLMAAIPLPAVPKTS
jgi:site-specific recombinase XerD